MFANDDCVIESELPEKTSGEETVAEVSGPVPLPVRIPPRVVEPVPPKLVARVVVAMMEPVELAKRSEEVIPVMARLVVVAFVVVELPLMRRLPWMVEEAALITRPPVVKIIVDVVADCVAAGCVHASYAVRPVLEPQSLAAIERTPFIARTQFVPVHPGIESVPPLSTSPL